MIPHRFGCPCVMCTAKVEDYAPTFAEAVERYRETFTLADWEKVMEADIIQQQWVEQIYSELGGES